MPQGLQLFNPDTGLVQLDFTTHVGRFLNTFSTNGHQTGSFSDARIIGHKFFYIGGSEVTANTSTGIISWNFTYTVSGSYDPPSFLATIHYGVY